MSQLARPFWKTALLLAGLWLITGCAYFNTFYNAQKYYAEGQRFKEQNQPSQAKAKFDKSIEKSALVIARWPRSRWVDDALFLIGMSYFQTGQFSKALKHFDQLLLAFPKSKLTPQAELYRGLALLKDREFGTARLALNEVRQRYRNLADDASFYLAQSYVEREEFETALDSLNRFVAQYPRSRFRVKAIKELAETSLRLKRWNEAEEWFRKYAFLESDAKRRTEAKLKIAICRYEEGKFQEAARQAQDVLGRYSDIDEEANLLLGKALLAQGRSDDALKTWARVRSASSAGAEAAFRIGRFYEEQKDFALARAYYDSAKLRRADSDYGVLAVKRLSLLDAFASQETTSQDAAKRLFLLAEVHNLNLGDFDQALVLYQQVYDSFPGSPWAPKALFANAWLLKNIKQDSAGAVPILKRIIAEYPETEYADESRRWLGLPVPKRKVVKVTAPAETVAAKSDSIKAPEPLPESKTIEEAEAEESTARPESPREPRPGMFPKGRHRPPGARELIDEATGLPKVTLVPVAETVAAPPAEETTVTQPPRPQLEIVHFDTDSWRIRPADTAALNQNARLLLANPSLKIVLIGHCDPRGTAEYNLKLGQRRADAVRDYLVSAGIPGERIVTRSEGENRLISANPDEFWLDRRVEFQLE